MYVPFLLSIAPQKNELVAEVEFTIRPSHEADSLAIDDSACAEDHTWGNTLCNPGVIHWD